ncbi:MAG: class II aldolase family protein [Candidatus Rokuibacteriota bacterium]|jgi:ribulose-5-phosphate 4-epimerase/fuculose-1-phosphate aldolase|nr:MAG: class II aldolase family protein [Candidatus Rokubacteria bacterium]
MTHDVLENAMREVVIANRILANERVVDAYGHVSVRHPLDPTRYLLSRSRAPELVERGDVIEFDLEGKAVSGDARPPYLERFIHGAIYETRPDVQAVVHAHADAVLPFTVSTVPLRPVVHMASFIGARLPVWDIRDRFGDTNLLVVNMAQGRDLAGSLGAERVVLMRGHGFTAAARSLQEVIRMAVYLPLNARVLAEALRLGEVKYLSRGEIDAHASMKPDDPSMYRAWEYWAVRAGCGDLLSARR